MQLGLPKALDLSYREPSDSALYSETTADEPSRLLRKTGASRDVKTPFGDMHTGMDKT